MLSFLVHIDVKEIRGIGLQVSKLQNVDISKQRKLILFFDFQVLFILFL